VAALRPAFLPSMAKTRRRSAVTSPRSSSDRGRHGHHDGTIMEHPSLPLSLPYSDLRAAGEAPAAYATQMKALEQEVREHRAALEPNGRPGSLDPGRPGY
jgi:hypothetical protein